MNTHKRLIFAFVVLATNLTSTGCMMACPGEPLITVNQSDASHVADAAIQDAVHIDAIRTDLAVADILIQDTLVDDTTGVDARIADTQSADTMRHDNTSDDTFSADRQSDDTQLVDTSIVDTASNDTSSADTNQADITRVDASGNDVFTCPDQDRDLACDDVDICPDGDDRVDWDHDGIPDFCDVCPYSAGEVCSATTACTSCEDCSTVIQAASADAVVVLANDIVATNTAACIQFEGASNLTFDCQGHSMSGNGDSRDGFFSGYSGMHNNVIRNCLIDGFKERGVFLSSSSGITVADSSSSGNQIGIQLYNSSQNTLQGLLVHNNFVGIDVLYNSDANQIRGNHIVDNIEVGLSFFPRLDVGDPENNSIFDNVLRNGGSGNLHVTKISGEESRVLGASNTFFHVDDCSQNNVIGCNCLGGNYWAAPDGQGFSETCLDANADGFCDSAFDMSQQLATMIDERPLSRVNDTCCADPDRDRDGYRGIACGGDDCDDDPSTCGALCHPLASELCDTYDNNCDNRSDEEDVCQGGILLTRAHYPVHVGSHACAWHQPTQKLYCFGGDAVLSTDRSATDAIVAYDPLANTVQNKSSVLPSIRSYLSCATSSYNDRIYCLGGYWQEFFCTDWETWGCVGGYSISHYLNDVIEYDPLTNTVSSKTTTLPQGRSSMACAADSATGIVYCFGGDVEGGTKTAEILAYDPSVDQLVVKNAVLPSPTHSHACAEDPQNHHIVCFGGIDDSNQTLDRIVIYDPASDSLSTSTAVLPAPRLRLACAWHARTQSIYCLGGMFGGSTYYRNVAAYDVNADSLQELDVAFDFGRHALACASVPSIDAVVCVGGSRNVVCHDEIVAFYP